MQGDNIPPGEAWLVSRYSKRAEIERFCEVTVILQSEESDRTRVPDNLLTLFKVELRPDIQPLPVADVYISPMQAMYRTPGPYLGNPSMGDNALPDKEEQP